ncbi:hypothetical protein FKM82_030207 [Ascaphus truei]
MCNRYITSMTAHEVTTGLAATGHSRKAQQSHPCLRQPLNPESHTSPHEALIWICTVFFKQDVRRYVQFLVIFPST